MKIIRLLPLAAVLVALSASAEVKLPNMLSSHMVLQRNQPIHLWGWADPGEQVKATMNAASATATADKLGKWSLYLPPQKAGGPFQVTISATNQITLDDVLIGDVWFASGQSNMEFPLLGFPGNAEMQNGAEEIRNSNQPTLRLMHIRTKASPYPLDDVNIGGNQSPTMQSTQDDSWTTCTPETAAKFSAVAYLFGREISNKEHVPVGLIDSTWGGTPAEAWVSLDSLSANASLMPVFAQWAEKSRNQADVPRFLAAEKREDAAAQAAGQPKPKHDWHPNLDSWNPSWLYNGMVAPRDRLSHQGRHLVPGRIEQRCPHAPAATRMFSPR